MTSALAANEHLTTTTALRPTEPPLAAGNDELLRSHRRTITATS